MKITDSVGSEYEETENEFSRGFECTSMSRKKMNENVPYFPRFPSSHTLFESRVKKTESSGACSTGKLMARPNVEWRKEFLQIQVFLEIGEMLRVTRRNNVNRVFDANNPGFPSFPSPRSTQLLKKTNSTRVCSIENLMMDSVARTLNSSSATEGGVPLVSEVINDEECNDQRTPSFQNVQKFHGYQPLPDENSYRLNVTGGQ